MKRSSSALSHWRIFAGIACPACSFILTWSQLPSSSLAIWPAICALVVILISRTAIAGLAAGVIAGAILIGEGSLEHVPRLLLEDLLFPSLSGNWHIAAILFTLFLGAFSGLLEKSGIIQSILTRKVGENPLSQKRVLITIYSTGLICFFDGLANALLTGRIARTFVDKAKISRERLAWIVDSTSSPVACVAFISTWIATQLSLIEQGVSHSAIESTSYLLYLKSIIANPYCLLTLLVIPLSICLSYQPKAMRKYQPVREPFQTTSTDISELPAWRAWLPLAVLIISIFLAFPLLTSERSSLFSIRGWQDSFSGSAGPYALVAGSILGLITAFLCFPKNRKISAREAATTGASNLLPALIILILAWSLGNVFKQLGAAEMIAQALSGNFSIGWLPLVIFLSGAAISFATGSSWGTMALLMPLALPAAIATAQLAGIDHGTTAQLVPAIIGAVFGGAVFGDHCSPFSDTTIVSSLAAGCEPLDHVKSQLPYALIVALHSVAAYALLNFKIPVTVALAISALSMTIHIVFLKKLSTR